MEEERAEHLWWSLEIGDEDADVEGAMAKRSMQLFYGIMLCSKSIEYCFLFILLL